MDCAIQDYKFTLKQIIFVIELQFRFYMENSNKIIELISFCVFLEPKN